MKKPLILSTLLLLSAGCGGSSGGGTSSPEAVAKALVKAVDKGSSKAVTGLFPTESVIKSVFDCPDKAHYKDLMEEINEEIRDSFLTAGGEEFTYVPCLNSSAAHLALLADIVETNLQGWI